MRTKTKLILSSCAVALVGATTAQAADPQLGLLERPTDRFERSISAHKLERRYSELYAESRKLDAAPQRNLLDRADRTRDELRGAIDGLSTRIERARKRAAATPSQSDYGLAGGVSQATLDAIAACESGGDPTAVDASGTYYGKYQFDTGTWASVGGSGSPADASEAEQDYRASLLYARAGSSPWPICGQ